MSLEVLKKTNQDSLYLAPDSGPIPPTYESETLPFEPPYLITYLTKYLPSFPISTKLYMLQ
jgi:hypothetical protein